jgi:alcohol dehydrogenase
MDNFIFQNTTKIFFGKGMLSHLGFEARKFGSKVLLTSGGGSIKRSGLYDQIVFELENHGIEVFHLSGIQPNPKLESIIEGVEICKKEHIDLIVAAGGGSCIDGSKAIAAGVKIDGDIWERFKLGEEITSAIPLASILTLPATGTEMNGNSVISRWDTKEKIPIYGPAIYPVFSILDPTYTFSVPEEHTVYGSIDIIIHALEQYFTHTNETPVLDYLTEGVIKTVVENTYRVLKDPNDYDARANLMFAGTVANNHWIGVGKKHDWASHNIEHELSALYDIPHGAGLAIIYPNWMKYVMKESLERFVKFASNVWDVDTHNKSDYEIALEGANKMREFFTKIGAPATLNDVGIDPANIPYFAQKVVRSGPVGGYKILVCNDVEEILRMCM